MKTLLHWWAVATRVGIPVVLALLITSPVRADDAECLECHARTADVVDLPPRQQIDVDAWEASIHAAMDFGCTDCHDGIEDVPHPEDLEPARCSNCHEEAEAQVSQSIHGRVDAFGEETCDNCHGVHEIRAIDDPGARVFSVNQPGTCGGCHADAQVVAPAGLDLDLIQEYQGSVHGLALGGDGDQQPAVCSDCHGAHTIRPAIDPDSPINPFRVPSTCAQCHEQEVDDYSGSVHGVAFMKGKTAAPTCNFCHGIHTISPVHAVVADSVGVAPIADIRTSCIACHGSATLMLAYGVKPDRVDLYEQSYHGRVHLRGGEMVADCEGCHGVHAIYRPDDPRSTVNESNLVATCGQCHEDANEEFANTLVCHKSKASVERSRQGKTIIAWVKKIYWGLLFGVLGGMFLHNLIIVSWYIRRKWREERGEVPMRRRFTGAQIVQHTLLFTSFFTLVITGFLLAYPETWWAQLLVRAGITEEVRRWIHRGAAIVMIAVSVVHLLWLLGTPYGRKELRRIAPGLRDLRDVVQNMRFHLGRSRHPAAFDKYDYPAKAEYWALVWGTIVMALTGLMLWFPAVVTQFLPGWSVELAEVIHLFEAWLATLAILVFHFFYVFGHPDIYPLNMAMFHGRMREELAEHHHPAWKEDESSDRARSRAAGKC